MSAAGAGGAASSGGSALSPSPADALLDGDRVPLWNKKLNRQISGFVAPKKKNLVSYLAKHPECEVFDPRKHGSGGGSGGSSGDADSKSFVSKSRSHRAKAASAAAGGGGGGGGGEDELSAIVAGIQRSPRVRKRSRRAEESASAAADDSDDAEDEEPEPEPENEPDNEPDSARDTDTAIAASGTASPAHDMKSASAAVSGSALNKRHRTSSVPDFNRVRSPPPNAATAAAAASTASARVTTAAASSAASASNAARRNRVPPPPALATAKNRNRLGVASSPRSASAAHTVGVAGAAVPLIASSSSSSLVSLSSPASRASTIIGTAASSPGLASVPHADWMPQPFGAMLPPAVASHSAYIPSSHAATAAAGGGGSGLFDPRYSSESASAPSSSSHPRTHSHAHAAAGAVNLSLWHHPQPPLSQSLLRPSTHAGALPPVPLFSIPALDRMPSGSAALPPLFAEIGAAGTGAGGGAGAAANDMYSADFTPPPVLHPIIYHSAPAAMQNPLPPLSSVPTIHEIDVSAPPPLATAASAAADGGGDGGGGSGASDATIVDDDYPSRTSLHSPAEGLTSSLASLVASTHEPNSTVAASAAALGTGPFSARMSPAANARSNVAASSHHPDSSPAASSSSSSAAAAAAAAAGHPWSHHSALWSNLLPVFQEHQIELARYMSQFHTPSNAAGSASATLTSPTPFTEPNVTSEDLQARVRRAAYLPLVMPPPAKLFAANTTVAPRFGAASSIPTAAAATASTGTAAATNTSHSSPAASTVTASKTGGGGGGSGGGSGLPVTAPTPLAPPPV